jgi:SAM-dependent methyltransferase
MEASVGLTFYDTDLAYVHDAGFGRFAESAAPLVVDALRRAGIEDGVIVDLGCGSGRASRCFCNAGFSVMGADLSAAMIALARERVPAAEFHVQSFVDFEFPRCVAVTGIGEVFNYVADLRNHTSTRSNVFSRIYEALVPDGILLFDIAGPDRAPASGREHFFSQSEDWAVFTEIEVDPPRNILTRHITTFRKSGELFRRSSETHSLELVEPGKVLELLQKIGFAATTLDSYGALKLPRGLHAFVARKPGEGGRGVYAEVSARFLRDTEIAQRIDA